MPPHANSPVADTFARDSLDPSILVADGYGLSLHVHRGQLVIRDGIGQHRRERQLPRAQRTITRLVLLGHTGSVSLDAIRWCTDTGIALLQVDTDGRLLLTAGAPGRADPRLRRAQAAAANAPVGVQVARALLSAKVDGQAAVAATLPDGHPLAAHLTELADRIRAAPDLPACRSLEAAASNLYFGGWAGRVRCQFARTDAAKIPDHWTFYATRSTPLSPRSRTPRGAADPINALLNYGYALAEAECRLAATAVALDPGLGIVHTDAKARDSLALDLLEPLRPEVDRRVLQLLERRHFRAADFHETRTGVCRLLPPLAHQLAETIADYARLIAPIAEHVAHAIARTTPGKITLTTPLSRANTTAAQTRGARSANRQPTTAGAAPRRTCEQCGAELYGAARKLCPTCWPVRRDAYIRQLSHSPALPSAGEPAAADQFSGGITLEQYRTQILPALTQMPLPEIEQATGLTNGSCSRLRAGHQIPHPRHWAALAALSRQTASEPDGPSTT